MTKQKYEEIVGYLKKIIEGTSWEGKVFTVGGCLRDALMGHDIHDVDLAVAVPDGGVLFPIWLEKKGLTLVPPTLYRRFSSSRLRLKAFPEEEIEVVQTRREQYTDENSRNPEVCFGSIQDDCERRDLTINSLYQNVTTGEVLDLTGRGIDDIRHHRIMTPMHPDETYKDDPIRILRTIRFAVRYGWRIPDNVWEAMKDNASRIKIVRRPRIATEFVKIMESNNPARLLRMMKDLGVMFKVMPELCHLYRIKDHSKRKELGPNAPLPTLWEVTMEELKNAGSGLEERFAALFSQFYRLKAPYNYITTALRRLMFDHDFIRRVKALVPHAAEMETETEGETENKGQSKKKKKRRGGRDRRRRRHRHGRESKTKPAS